MFKLSQAEDHSKSFTLYCTPSALRGRQFGGRKRDRQMGVIRLSDLSEGDADRNIRTVCEQMKTLCRINSIQQCIIAQLIFQHTKCFALCITKCHLVWSTVLSQVSQRQRYVTKITNVSSKESNHT